MIEINPEEQSNIIPEENSPKPDELYRQGLALLEGKGAQNGMEEAAECFGKASEAGHAAATYCLGLCCLRGLGVEKNEEEAVNCFRRAAYAGHTGAERQLGLCYLKGAGVVKDFYAAYEYFASAASQGDAKAQRYAGNMCYFGKGVVKDVDMAADWYRTALAGGDKKSRTLLARIAAENTEDFNSKIDCISTFLRQRDESADTVINKGLSARYLRSYCDVSRFIVTPESQRAFVDVLFGNPEFVYKNTGIIDAAECISKLRSAFGSGAIDKYAVIPSLAGTNLFTNARDEWSTLVNSGDTDLKIEDTNWYVIASFVEKQAKNCGWKGDYVRDETSDSEIRPDISQSTLFTNLHSAQSGLSRFSREEHIKNIIYLTASCCAEYASENPAFPGNDALLAMACIGADDMAKKEEYMPYLEKFDSRDAVFARAENTLTARAHTNPDDSVAELIMAALCFMNNRRNSESANLLLYRILINESNGIKVPGTLFVELAGASGFEKWYRYKFGVLSVESEEPVLANGEAPVQDEYRTVESQPAALKERLIKLKDSAADNLVPFAKRVIGETRYAYTLSNLRRSDKLTAAVLILAALSVLCSLVGVAATGFSILKIIACLALLVTVVLKVPADTTPAAVPFGIFAASLPFCALLSDKPILFSPVMRLFIYPGAALYFFAISEQFKKKERFLYGPLPVLMAVYVIFSVIAVFSGEGVRVMYAAISCACFFAAQSIILFRSKREIYISLLNFILGKIGKRRKDRTED